MGPFLDGGIPQIRRTDQRRKRFERALSFFKPFDRPIFPLFLFAQFQPPSGMLHLPRLAIEPDGKQIGKIRLLFRTECRNRFHRYIKTVLRIILVEIQIFYK